MRKNFGPVPYTGMTTINQLISLAKSKGTPWARTGASMSFNQEGYAFLPTKATTPRVLVIDRDPRDNLAAYIFHKGSYRQLQTFTDPERAAELIADLYTNPYYHGTPYYKQKIANLIKDLDVTKFKDRKKLLAHFQFLYHQGEYYLKQIKRGAETYGRAHRYLAITHLPYELMNYLLVNFSEKQYTLDHKVALAYEGEEWDGSYQFHMKLTTFNYKDIHASPEIFEGFKVEAGDASKYLVESIAAKKLWFAAIDAPEDTIACIRTINQSAVDHNLFPSPEYKADYVAQLETLNGDNNALRAKFSELYIKLLEDNNMKAPDLKKGSLGDDIIELLGL